MTTSDDLERIYRDYLDTLNERRFDDLGRFVHDELTYNGAHWTLAQYQDLLVRDARQIPDLRYTAELLVVAGDQVACRLWFACSPRGEFLGIDVGGRYVEFAEHVFYRFRAGRIDQVRSVLDAAAIRRQLGLS